MPENNAAEQPAEATPFETLPDGSHGYGDQDENGIDLSSLRRNLADPCRTARAAAASGTIRSGAAVPEPALTSGYSPHAELCRVRYVVGGVAMHFAPRATT
jgi:hypothetical protein